MGLLQCKIYYISTLDKRKRWRQMQEGNNEIRLKTVINKEDYRSITYFNIFTKTKFRAVLFVIISLIVVCELVLHLMGIRRVEGFELYFDYFVVLVMILLPIEVEVICRRMAKTDKVMLGVEQEIIINHEGIRCKNINSTSKYEWPLMYRAYENKKYFLIFVNTQQAVIIPKRDLESLQIEQLRVMIQHKILSKNKLKKKR